MPAITKTGSSNPIPTEKKISFIRPYWDIACKYSKSGKGIYKEASLIKYGTALPLELANEKVIHLKYDELSNMLEGNLTS